MKPLAASRRFQPGEGPSRGLLRDCTTSPINRFAALVIRVTIARAQGAVLRSPGPDIQSTDWRCPCQAVVLVVVARAVVRRRQGDRVRVSA